MSSKIPFPATQRSREFMNELMQMVVNRMGKATTKLISKENIQVFYHGLNWTFQRQERADFSTQTGELHKQQIKVHLEVERIRNHDLSLIPEFIERTVNDFDEQFQQRIFATVDKVTEETGNVIAIPKGGSVAQATLEALRNLEFGVECDGTVSLPSLFLNPQTHRRLSAEIGSNPDAHKAAVDAILEKKKEEALLRERQRLSRYETN